MTHDATSTTDLIDAFDSDWNRYRNGRSHAPDLVEFLNRAASLPERSQKLVKTELALVDMEYRWRLPSEQINGSGIGAQPNWQKYIAIMPQHFRLDGVSDSAIAEEYRIRRRWGDRPDCHEFSRTFSGRDLVALLESVDAELRADDFDEQVDDARLWARSPAAAHLRHDDFLLMALLGQGGMGKVYRALHKSSGKMVAVKALRKDRQLNPIAVDAFVREASVAAQLVHPNIVRVWGLGKFPAGGHFIVFDVVEGTDVQREISNGRLNVERAVRIAVEVADAIEFAHASGVLHCDLKPANILLDEQGVAFVADFGFAQLVSDHTDSAFRIRGGTRGYMAPELGAKSELRPTVDVYGLGGLLFAMMTGSPPNAAPRELVRLAEHSSEVGRNALTIAMRCLSRNPIDRPQSAAEVASYLRRICE
jgi:tRNA A-37 threonylcarbamoyl transferase component Bud32